MPSFPQRSRLHRAAWISALVLVPGFYSSLAPQTIQTWSRAIHLKTIGYLYVAAVLIFLFLRFGDDSRKDRSSSPPG